MACTIDTSSVVQYNLAQSLNIVVLEFAGPASYTAAGETIDVSSYIKSEVIFATIDSTDTAADNLYKVDYVRAASGAPATGKVTWSWSGTDGAVLKDVTATTTLSGEVYRMVLFGTDA
jgi:hypothetical protein